MIIYDLKCRDGHKFEGWFKDRGAFEEQNGAKTHRLSRLRKYRNGVDPFFGGDPGTGQPFRCGQNEDRTVAAENPQGIS